VAPSSEPHRDLSVGESCVGVFFAGNILLWADRSNFSVAAAA
jgi:hypothetical protein